MSQREVFLWARQDGGEPKSVGQDATRGPGPGPVYAVQASTVKDARKKLRAWLKVRVEWEQLGAEARAVLERREPVLAQVREVTGA